MRLITAHCFVVLIWYCSGSLQHNFADAEPFRAQADPKPCAWQCNCARYHVGHNSLDPSGPLLMDDGTWHMFPIDAGWGHCTSKDLLHWDCTHPSTHFDGYTGALSSTPSGIFALWPVRNGDPDGPGVLMAEPTNNSLDEWIPKGIIGVPQGSTRGGFRDPGRAIQLPSGWYVPAGVAGIHWFRADSDKMTHLNWTGLLVPHGQDNITEFECPDVFALDGKIVVMVATQGKRGWTQYWIGEIAKNDTTFIPESTGRLDYGADGVSSTYAAKTGTNLKAPFSRRVLFGFTGWSSRVPCGSRYLLPKDLSISDGRLIQRPAKELEGLRQNQTQAPALAPGAQIEVIITCKLPSPPPTSGKLALSTLRGGTGDQANGVEIGYDFQTMQGYAKVPISIGNRTDTVDLGAMMSRGGSIELRSFVDGHMIETFFGDYAFMTTATNNMIHSVNLTSTVINTAKLSGCDVSSWVLGL